MDYPLGPWEPDRPLVGAPDQKTGALRVRTAEYVYRLLDGYVPVPSAVVRSVFGTLAGGSCRGARGVRVADGTTYLVVGSPTKLYLTSAGALVDRTGATVPALAAADRWDFDAYDNRVLATSLGVNGIQSSTGAAFADLAADAPKAAFIFSLDKFLVAADIQARGANGYGTRREGLHWCGRGEPTYWLADGSDAALAKQADWFPLRGDSGRITLALSTGTYAFIARERAAWRMDYDGGPEVMAFDPVEKERGCVAPGGGIALGGRVYFPSEEGFLVYDGERCNPIGWEKIDRTWAAALSLPGDLDLMSAGHDFEARTIWFLHPTSQRAFLYNYLTDEWTSVPIAAEWIFGMLPIAESLDTGSLAAANLDVPPQDTLNLDSLGGAGVNETIAIFTTAHQIATLDGSRVTTARLQTCRFELEPGRRALVRGVRPIDDNLGGTIAASVRSYLRPDAAEVAPDYRQVAAVGRAPARAAGRYHEVDLLFGGDETVTGFDLVASLQGVR